MLSLLKRKLYFKNSNQRLLKDCVFIILRDVNIVKKKKIIIIASNEYDIIK